jgi:hypothetical protein
MKGNGLKLYLTKSDICDKLSLGKNLTNTHTERE